MTRRTEISDQVTVITGQPSAEEIERLPREGFGSMVNPRMAGEPNQPLSPEAEGEIAGAAGPAPPGHFVVR